MTMRLFSILLLTVLSGCAVVNVSSKGGITMAEISNTGWFLFSFIPLGSGNPDKPNEMSMKCFQDTTSLENNMLLLNKAIASKGAKSAKNITSVSTDEKIFIMLLRRFTFHTSAELVFENQTSAKDLQDNANN